MQNLEREVELIANQTQIGLIAARDRLQHASTLLLIQEVRQMSAAIQELSKFLKSQEKSRSPIGGDLSSLDPDESRESNAGEFEYRNPACIILGQEDDDTRLGMELLDEIYQADMPEQNQD